MTALSHALRILPLGLAALASMATSAPPTEVAFSVVSPFHGETAVSVDVVPSVAFYVEEDATRPSSGWLSLRHADGSPVTGRVESRDTGSYNPVFRFVPDAPLAPGDYQLVVDHGGAISDYRDGEQVEASVFAFTTRSVPRIMSYGLDYPGSTQAVFELSQAVDEASLLAHLTGLDATGDPIAISSVVREDYKWEAYSYQLTLPPGVVDIALADGLLAADGTPVPGLPLLFSDPLAAP